MANKSCMSFGNRLLQLRKQHQFSQLEMSEKLHMEQSTYSRYETDKIIPTADIITRVVNLFNVTADWLLQSDSNQVHFEDNSTNTGVVINHGIQHSYNIPKEMVEMIISQQRSLEMLMQKLIERL